jgi:hypothetical protein
MSQLRLQDYEQFGYRFGIEGGRLAVTAPSKLMSTQAIEQMRRCRDDLVTEVNLRNFCQLVRHHAADRQCLLSYEEILAGLDDDDMEDLLNLDRQEKQVWAELLAHRLTRSKVWPTEYTPQRKWR